MTSPTTDNGRKKKDKEKTTNGERKEKREGNDNYNKPAEAQEQSKNTYKEETR